MKPSLILTATTLSAPIPIFIIKLFGLICCYLSRFEDVTMKEDITSLKRPRESDAKDTEPLSKTAQKKLNKKLKAEGGKVVATGSGAVSVESGDEKKSKKEKKEKKEKKGEKEKPKSGAEGVGKDKGGAVKMLEGGIKVVEGAPGTGVQAKKGNTIAMRYIGKLQNGKIFDQNTKGKPVGFVS